MYDDNTISINWWSEILFLTDSGKIEDHLSFAESRFSG